ncbi:ligase-associated DNA damage response exonuclease [Parafilimonas terrae]|uniref:Putative mRNA 3-end processing factor n=1 Tax=Parafilimonas terrae TaxID=1465490 RepID=A0A1I5SU00_9BACT|nr:ligase-associated DNA damage response exonuclease [Parafilimonas terrae]SFP74225.1 putative mRNA 3-end processing factor [Parafilimonas terrae]
MPLIEFTDKGLFCRAGNFYIDPWKPVNYAIITHAHSDHAKWGSKNYLCHTLTKPLLQARLGNNHYETMEWNETKTINGVKVSLHPAGHIIGSSQVRVECNNEVWVASGDYKVANDGISGAFEPVKCNAFITESTFGLPIYCWKHQEAVFENMRNWILANKALNKTSIIIAYSLGKAQRVLKALEDFDETIFMHGATWNMHQAIINAGISLPKIKAERVMPETSKEKLKESIVIAPPGAEGSSWLKKFSPYAIGVCSGWMQVRGNVRRKNVDGAFVLSDHADWTGLLQAIKATKAEKVYVTHGYQAVFSRYLNEKGIWSAEVKTEYGEEEEEKENAAGLAEESGKMD